MAMDTKWAGNLSDEQIEATDLVLKLHQLVHDRRLTIADMQAGFEFAVENGLDYLEVTMAMVCNAVRLAAKNAASKSPAPNRESPAAQG